MAVDKQSIIYNLIFPSPDIIHVRDVAREGGGGVLNILKPEAEIVLSICKCNTHSITAVYSVMSDVIINFSFKSVTYRVYLFCMVKQRGIMILKI